MGAADGFWLRRRRSLRLGRGRIGDLGDELIAHLGNSLDELRVSGAVAQASPQVENGLDDGIHGDCRVRPKFGQQFLFGDDAVTVIDQVNEEVESLRSERDYLLAAAQSPSPEIQLEVPEIKLGAR